MTPIKYPRDPKELDTFEKDYLALFCQKGKLQRKLRALGINIEIKDLLTMKFEEILSIYHSYDRTTLGARYQSVKSALVYDSYSAKIADFFMKYERTLKLSVCFYCNIDFINAFKYQEVDKNCFTIDHVLDKSSNPLFALSLYNFVPSCYTCNSKAKKDKALINSHDNLTLSPSYEGCNVNSKINFSILPKDESGDSITIENVHEFDIEILTQADFNGYIELFMLKERYQFHKPIVLKMLQKHIRYGKSGIQNLIDGLEIDEEMFYKDIYGDEIFEGDLNEAPFTKLKKDIYLLLEDYKSKP